MWNRFMSFGRIFSHLFPCLFLSCLSSILLITFYLSFIRWQFVKNLYMTGRWTGRSSTAKNYPSVLYWAFDREWPIGRRSDASKGQSGADAAKWKPQVRRTPGKSEGNSRIWPVCTRPVLPETVNRYRYRYRTMRFYSRWNRIANRISDRKLDLSF